MGSREDLAGTVERVGAKITRFSPSDEVFGAGYGSFAEYAVAPEKRLAHKLLAGPRKAHRVWMGLEILLPLAGTAVPDRGGRPPHLCGRLSGLGGIQLQIAAVGMPAPSR